MIRAKTGITLIAVGVATLGLTADAQASSSVTIDTARKCGTDHGFPGVYKARTVNLPRLTRGYAPRWLVACGAVGWVKAGYRGRTNQFPRSIVIHGASWTAGRWQVRLRVVTTRDGGYGHFVVSQGRKRIVFNGYS